MATAVAAVTAAAAAIAGNSPLTKNDIARLHLLAGPNFLAMNKPFAKSDPPLSYAEGPRLSRALKALPMAEQERFVNRYKAHLASPNIVSIQRRGHLIYFTIQGTDAPEVYDFGQEVHAQRVLSAFTDCLRANSASVKVLMAGMAPPPA